MPSGVTIRIRDTMYRLEASDVELVVEELEKLETDPASRIASALTDSPAAYVPEREDALELLRALDHLRNLKRIPARSELTSLRDTIRRAFAVGSVRYRLDPQTGERQFDSFNWGPTHAVGDRLVDVATGREWYVARFGPPPTLLSSSSLPGNLAACGYDRLTGGSPLIEQWRSRVSGPYGRRRENGLLVFSTLFEHVPVPVWADRGGRPFAWSASAGMSFWPGASPRCRTSRNLRHAGNPGLWRVGPDRRAPACASR